MISSFKNFLIFCSIAVAAVDSTYVWNGSLELQLQYVTNVTNLLNSILYGYDKLIRPSENDEPTNVKIDIEIRSMGPISDMDMVLLKIYPKKWLAFKKEVRLPP